MNTLPKPVLALIISFSFSNRAVCRRWRDAMTYSFVEDDFKKIVKFGSESVLRLFLMQHPSVDLNYGLYHACKKEHEHIAQILIQLGAKDWDYGLYGACYSGDKSLVLLMIQYGASDLDGPLIIACKKGHKSIVKILIQHGAEDFYRGMFYACTHRNLGVAKYLSHYVDRETYSEYLNKYCY